MARSEAVLAVNGADVCVETFGQRDDPAVLMIAGSACSMLYWDEELCRSIADRGRFVIRYDHRDTGRSTTSPAGAPDYALRDLVADAAGVLEALGIRRARVVGMSMGGAIAQLLALDRPELVDSLVLLASTPGGPGHDHPDLPPMTEAIQALFAGSADEPDWTDRDAVIEYHVEAERPYAGSHGFDEERMRDLATRTFDRSADMRASLTNHFILDAGEPWRDRLRTLDAPVLVVHGEDDPAFPPGHAVALVDELPNAELLLLPGVGHEVPPREAWPAFIDAAAGR